MRLVERLLGLETRQVDQAVRIVRLEQQMDKKVRDYSLGMKQRLGIAMALARQPRLLILDEPTNGLDPAGIEEMRTLLRRLADDGVTVMVSSHLLGEIDKTATVLGILSGGRMIFQGTRAELMTASTPDLLITCRDTERAGAILANLDARALDGQRIRIRGLDDERTAGVVAALVGEGVAIFEVRRHEQTLEDVFMRFTADSGL